MHEIRNFVRVLVDRRSDQIEENSHPFGQLVDESDIGGLRRVHRIDRSLTEYHNHLRTVCIESEIRLRIQFRIFEL